MTADHVSVKVRRLDIPRFRVFQVAAGAGIALSVIGRRVQGFPFSVCVSEYVIALFLGLRAYGWLGRREIVFLADHILIGEGGPPVHPRDVRMWGVGEGEVRFYAADFTFVWRLLLPDDGQLEVFRARLTKPFGRPRILARRGSRRRRTVAVGLAFAGAGAFALGLRLGTAFYGLGFLGVLTAAFALSSFLISSQKVLRREASRE